MLTTSHSSSCYLSRILGHRCIHIYFCKTAWGSYSARLLHRHRPHRRAPWFDLLKLPNKSLNKTMHRERALKLILMDRLSSRVPHCHRQTTTLVTSSCFSEFMTSASHAQASIQCTWLKNLVIFSLSRAQTLLARLHSNRACLHESAAPRNTQRSSGAMFLWRHTSTV